MVTVFGWPYPFFRSIRARVIYMLFYNTNYHTIVSCLPCLDGPWPDPNSRESCMSLEKSANHEPKASSYARFSNLEQHAQVFGSSHPNTETIK